jgi:hypothetical protein
VGIPPDATKISLPRPTTLKYKCRFTVTTTDQPVTATVTETSTNLSLSHQPTCHYHCHINQLITITVTSTNLSLSLSHQPSTSIMYQNLYHIMYINHVHQSSTMYINHVHQSSTVYNNHVHQYINLYHTMYINHIHQSSTVYINHVHQLVPYHVHQLSTVYINHVHQPVPYHVHQSSTMYHTKYINHVHLMHQPYTITCTILHIQDHQEVPLTMYYIIIKICASTMCQNKYQTMNHNITKMCLNMYYHHQACTITSPRYASSIYHITHDMSQSCHTPCTIRYRQ